MADERQRRVSHGRNARRSVRPCAELAGHRCEGVRGFSESLLPDWPGGLVMFARSDICQACKVVDDGTPENAVKKCTAFDLFLCKQCHDYHHSIDDLQTPLVGGS